MNCKKIPNYIEENAKGDVLLKLYIQPRSSKNSIEGEHDGALKVKITSPPVDGEANAMVIELFSKILKIRKTALTIVKGESSRRKTVLIDDITAEGVKEALSKHIQP